MTDAEPIPLLVIVGPTAVGKTELAILVAEALGGEIVSADSMAVYREMDVATAKPTPEERARVPFHLIDVVDPAESYTVAQFQNDADRAIASIHGRGKLPLLVGGTGLYVQAVVDRLVFPPGPSDDSVRRRLAASAKTAGSDSLHAQLRRVDPASADRIHPRDTKRIIRALEVYELTGRPMSSPRAVDDAQGIGYNTAQFGILRPRTALYERIAQRVDAMFERGLLEETRRLRRRGVPASAQSMQALGTKQVLAHLSGALSLAEAVELTKRETRRYAKRQLTWFRHHGQIEWIDVPEGADLCAAAESVITRGRREFGGR